MRVRKLRRQREGRGTYVDRRKGAGPPPRKEAAGRQATPLQTLARPIQLVKTLFLPQKRAGARRILKSNTTVLEWSS